MRFHPAIPWCVLGLALTGSVSCSRGPRLSGEAYLEAVTAFHVSLAAMQTSQDVLARSRLERVIQLVPDEPAPWANLGLLLLRQQQIDEALQRLTKATELAPDNAHIVRLLALAEAQKGNADAAISRWRRAAALDPADVKAPFALALELERQGGAAQDEEAQRILGALAARSGNLAVQIEHARLAARRGDGAALRQSLDALASRSRSWPPDAQARLQAARDAAAANPGAAATAILFLKNLLIREPEYRAAFAAVTTPRSEIGEPLTAFVLLDNPPPRPADPDTALAFTFEDRPSVASPGTTWAGAMPLTADGPATIIAAGPREVRVATGAALPFPSGPSAAAPSPAGVAPADLNYDFRIDLVLAGAGGLRIFRQDGQGGFADVTALARLDAAIVAAPLHGAWPADVDTDGDLDLVVAPRDAPVVVLRNNGDDTFAEISPFANVPRGRGFVWADIDGEGVPDAVLLDDRGTVRTFVNLRGGVFRERPVPPAFAQVGAIGAAEVTGDAVMDAVGVTAAGVVMRLSAAPSGGGWSASEIARVEVPPGLSTTTGRLLVADVDNNAAADLIVADGTSSRVLLAGADGAFSPLRPPVAYGVAAAVDVDGNGRLELVAASDAGARIARSQGQRQYGWQTLRLRAATATGDQRINSFGIGGEVEVRSGLHAQKQVISSPAVHFGLGEAPRVAVARIVWPNGILQSEFDLAAGATVTATQRLKGSCPWLFGWNGREMGFITDFIWRSPLGLRINAQATADVLMTEEWVKVRGDQLAPKDGAYELRVTAELWETHFFDLVSLLVVDHPAGTEIFVDERFAVPPPRLEAIATGPVQAVSAARDDFGRDVRDLVSAADDRHLDFAGRGRYQGVTRDHYVEIELPEEAPRTGPLWLIAKGWVHPTDSSVNVALGQGSHPPPAGLSLHVADAAGRFRPVKPGLGFPAGKDKTVLIDLAGVFPPRGPRRMRLQTNLEIFWDRLGWAAGRPEVAIEPRRIGLASAELRYRGFSETRQRDKSTPERPRYAVLEGTAPRWRDLEGFHTRFGDVRELLLQVDDRYVIMNAGDEMVLRFPEVPAPGPGVVRDFVVIGDGWEKDGDYNTTASRTVLPLPTHRSPTYVPGSGRLEDDPVYRAHQRDWELYHTRYVTPEALREALRPGK